MCAGQRESANIACESLARQRRRVRIPETIEERARARPSTSGGRRPRRCSDRTALMEPRSTCRDSFAFAFVCTGKRARSPLAQALFGSTQRPRREGQLVRDPCRRRAGSPRGPRLQRALGVDLSAHASRSVRDVDLSQADLVLGFEPAHVSAAVVDGGADIGRTFLLGELVLSSTSRSPTTIRARTRGSSSPSPTATHADAARPGASDRRPVRSALEGDAADRRGDRPARPRLPRLFGRSVTERVGPPGSER